METNNSELCRICISTNSQMITIFGEDSLWKKITTLADVKIEKGDTLPQQVCVNCAKNAISACLFKKKCEDADNFFRQQLLIQKIEGKVTSPRGNKLGTEHSSDDAYFGIENGGSRSDDVGEIDDDGSFQAKHCNEFNNGHHIRPLNDNEIVEDDGEIKCVNDGDKPPFDFQSIRLMHEYMQQQLSKYNGVPSHIDGSHSVGSGSDANGDDDEEPLPLIPEIELITPSEDMTAASGGLNVDCITNGKVAGMNGTTGPLRGYQCPNCFQIFEMKQILKAHMQSVHGTAGPVYECSNCKKTYFYKRFLEKHVRRGRCVKKRRNQTRPMQCSDCHVLFPTGHHLGWHKRTGCPSRAAKMPLQQLFKQNIVQYNNFPKRIGIRKPENAIYLHNRKLLMANKRKGRTRIKLDAKKIALAKQLILREATTTVIANELNISRTFAWRLRKSLVNGVSLHERVIDPNSEEVQEASALLLQEQQRQKQEDVQIQLQPHKEQQLKYEEDEEDDDDDDDDDGDGEDEEEERPSHEEDGEADGEDEMEDHHPHTAAKLVMNASGKQTALTEQYAQLHQTAAEIEVGGDGEYETETDGDGDENATEDIRIASSKRQQPQLGQQQHEQLFLQNIALHGVPENKVAEAAVALKDLKYQKHFINGQNELSLVMPSLHPFPTNMSAPINPLPVNLSIRPLASMQKKETLIPAPAPPSTSNNQGKKPRKPNVFIDDEKYAMAQTLVTQNASTMEIARALNVSQMTAWKVRDAIIKGVPLSYRNKRGEVGVPRLHLTNKSDESTNESHEPNSLAASAVDAEILNVQYRLQQQQQHLQQQIEQQRQEQQQKIIADQFEKQQQAQLELLQQQQQQLIQQEKIILQEQERRRQLEEEQQQQQQQQQKKQQQQLQRYHTQQTKQQSLQLQPSTSNMSQHTNNTNNNNNINNNNISYNINSNINNNRKNINNILSTNHINSNSNNKNTNNNNSNNSNNNDNNINTKLIHPRRRLKAAEREQRDKEITREILELIKEDSNIQYWKVSARLAEKGYPISPSSVCQKLKSMGIHRRWKPGDKPPLMLAPVDGNEIKTNFNTSTTTAAAVATITATNSVSSADESYEQQFELGGAHFLSAFTN